MFFASKKNRILPGFGLTLGYTIFYLSLIVLLPLAGLVTRTAQLTWSELWSTISDPQAVAAYRLTFGAAFGGALINTIFGSIVAWTLVRYEFFGKKFLDALIDIPFALPTAVSGLALTAVYDQNGWLGKHFYALGIPTSASRWGVLIAMTFIGLPFVVRSVQPALEELDAENEEAAQSLGASRLQTFWYVILPAIVPSLFTGFALSFARGLGEYGSIIFIAGKKYMETEITSLLILEKMEQNNLAGATALALTMLVASFTVLLSINGLQWWMSRKLGTGA